MVTGGWKQGLLLFVLTGCAGSGATTTEPPTSATPDRAQPTAALIYTVGEEHYARGEYAQAVELWRNAIVALPPTSAADEIRHALILRLAHGQLMAWHASGDASELHDAQQMLERYLEKHTALFGETEHATAQRGEVYELLHVVEQSLAPPPEPSTLDEQPGDENEPEEGDPPVTDTDSDSDSDSDSEFSRTIIVRRARPSVDDPKIVALLRGEFTNPFRLQGVLTFPGPQILHGPRPLLRAAGAATLVAADDSTATDRRHARQLGRELLTASRPALKSCYDAAYARHPIGVARSTIEVQIGESGQIEHAQIVDGGVVDTLGDLCVVRKLEGTIVPRNDDNTAVTSIRLPLTFFYQDPVYFNEANGRSAPARVLHQADANPGVPKQLRPGQNGSSTSGRSRGA